MEEFLLENPPMELPELLPLERETGGADSILREVVLGAVCWPRCTFSWR
jgi:hypothetical protein